MPVTAASKDPVSGSSHSETNFQKSNQCEQIGEGDRFLKKKKSQAITHSLGGY